MPFIKMEGAGNDYVYIDLIKNSNELDFKNLDYKDLAQKISQRHFGVGSDGLVLILPSSKAACKMRMFNADGSEAEMCGNAIRCVARYVYDHGYHKRKKLQIETLAGLKNLSIIKDEKDHHKISGVRVDMGEPVLSGKSIPVKEDKEPVVGLTVMNYRGTAVSMGNPHFVIFTDEITDTQVLQHGPDIEQDPLFPNRTNVEFVKIVTRDLIDMRVWERGSGETLACGTGACASVVASVLNNLTSRTVDVRLRGGVLRIEWNEKDNRVYLTGPAREVFSGLYHHM
ncbi:MAG: diaminopimelate epimerase [Spirochaetota bacterium]|nr:MAG: diaminopimelate epimerase [Spirochaetota bacterium]